MSPQTEDHASLGLALKLVRLRAGLPQQIVEPQSSDATAQASVQAGRRWDAEKTAAAEQNRRSTCH